ncbi:serine O-acetyltransferase [Kitasatospora sp. NPDC093550]|uniref:serine O-acetyltransferase n=1 Tax=Kitasatospora sp. NPDC093550 TaxID=3364089 RepID=UPI003806AD8B
MSSPAIPRSVIEQDLRGLADRLGPARSPELSERVVRLVLSRVGGQVAEDLAAFAGRDAAAHGDQRYIYSGYLSFRSVMAHRLAHAVGTLRLPGVPADLLTAQARRISEEARLATGVEIHPGAAIGRRFVVDHGSGTVIGEDCEIGDDCYFLQNIVLGARDIVARSDGSVRPRRHPRIGSRVQIGGDVCVFGPVCVGDDCVIDPGARITTDVPAGARVRVVSTTQISLTERAPVVHGVAVVAGCLVITGCRLHGTVPVVLDGNRTPCASLTVVGASDTEMHCRPAGDWPARPSALGLLSRGQLVCYVRPVAEVLNRCRDDAGRPQATSCG